jgi:hypothetical protein
MLIENEAVTPPPGLVAGGGHVRAGGITAWLGSYEYAEVIRTFLPDLVAAEGLKAIEVMNDQLETWLRHGGRGIVVERMDHSLYGQHFGVLLHVMLVWAQSRPASIFGSAPPLDGRQHAAGAAYLALNHPNVGLLATLRPQCEAWVKAVAAGDFDQEPLYSFDSIAERLAAHLLLFYAWGRIEVHDELLAEFFDTAPIQVRSRALAHVGWQLWKSTDPVPADVLERLTALWESRRAAIVSTTRAASDDAPQKAAIEELAAFGWWFRSDKFDRHWALRELRIALDNGADIETAGGCRHRTTRPDRRHRSRAGPSHSEPSAAVRPPELAHERGGT